MKNFSVIITLIVLNSVSVLQVQAKSMEVQMLEGEIRGGLTTPIEEYHAGRSQINASFAIEGRVNFKNRPWDCGLLLDLSTARRSYEHLSLENHWLWQTNRTLAISVVGNYNFQQGDIINPFIGTAIGVAINDVVGDRIFPSKGTTMFFATRIGVEFLHFFRLMAQCNLCRKGFNNLSLSLGLVLGGRPKKSY